MINLRFLRAGEHGAAIGTYWHRTCAASNGDSGYLFRHPYSEVSSLGTSYFCEAEGITVMRFLLPQDCRSHMVSRISPFPYVHALSTAASCRIMLQLVRITRPPALANLIQIDMYFNDLIQLVSSGDYISVLDWICLGVFSETNFSCTCRRFDTSLAEGGKVLITFECC